MKGYILALMCCVALVQARSTSVQNGQRAPAAPGQAPWFLHLRLVTSNGGGRLRSCAGVLIDNSWVLTTADCVASNTFIWIRYGAVDVLRPALVTEVSNTSNPAIRHPTANLALINIRRVVHSTDTISPVSVATEASNSDGEVTSICAFGEEEGAAGGLLSCFPARLEVDGETVTAHSEEGKATASDLGAPLVVDGKLVGLLDRPGSEENAGVFLKTANFVDWIEEQTGLELGSQ